MLTYEQVAMLDDATLRAVFLAKVFTQPAPRQPIDWAALAQRASCETPQILGE